MLNKFHLYRLISRNTKLSAKRHPMFEQSQWGKVLAYIGASIIIVYFVAIGTMLGYASRGDDYGTVFVFIPFILLIDFFMRFGIQETPSMLAKPYLLLPISKFTVVECFLLQMLNSSFNWFWMSFSLPCAFICWCGGTPSITAIMMIVVLHLLILVNSQWYLLCRTLINQNMLWWIVPAIPYGSLALFIWLASDKVIEASIDFCVEYGFTWLSFFMYLVVGTSLFIVNRRIQMHLIYKEVARHDATSLKHVSSFTALDRFGQIGEYLKLEIKSIMRNKAIRARFISGVVVIIMLSLIIAYSDVYDGNFGTNMWCLYCFVYFGAVCLIKIMGQEGNYIDLLMVHHENIYSMLRAKYYFFCAILLLPLLLLLPPIISGKFPLLMILAYLFITSGLEYFILFQMTVYNRQTLPLNEKISGKGQIENKMQFIVEMMVFSLPVALSLLIGTFFGFNIAYIVLIIIGLGFTLTHNLWLKNIYRRTMRRRYENLEGFHSTR